LETAAETQPTGEGGVRTTLDTPEPPPVDPLPLDSPPRPLQFMPPPPNPPRIDEDETMDVVPDSEPSRLADGPMSSLHLPQPASRVLTLAEDDNETVPETDNEISERRNPDQTDQDANMQETEAETEQEDHPMDSDHLLVEQQSPKHVVEQEEQVEQEVHDDATVPETEDDIPLATVIKSAKAATKPLPPRGRSTRNKRPIIYTESPDTSENEVSTMKF